MFGQNISSINFCEHCIKVTKQCPEVALSQAQRCPDGGKTSPAEQSIVRFPWPDLGGGPRGNMLQRSWYQVREAFKYYLADIFRWGVPPTPTLKKSAKLYFKASLMHILHFILYRSQIFLSYLVRWCDLSATVLSHPKALDLLLIKTYDIEYLSLKYISDGNTLWSFLNAKQG